jgi:hypothetical protein
VCLSEELSAILQNEVIGVSLKIALILGRQHGWPIDYMYNHFNSKFVLVVTITPESAEEIAQREQSMAILTEQEERKEEAPKPVIKKQFMKKQDKSTFLTNKPNASAQKKAQEEKEAAEKLKNDLLK